MNALPFQKMTLFQVPVHFSKLLVLLVRKPDLEHSKS